MVKGTELCRCGCQCREGWEDEMVRRKNDLPLLLLPDVEIEDAAEGAD